MEGTALNYFPLYTSVELPVCLPIWLPWLAAGLTVCLVSVGLLLCFPAFYVLCLSISVCLLFYLFVSLFVCLFVLSACLPVCLSAFELAGFI